MGPGGWRAFQAQGVADVHVLRGEEPAPFREGAIARAAQAAPRGPRYGAEQDNKTRGPASLSLPSPGGAHCTWVEDCPPLVHPILRYLAPTRSVNCSHLWLPPPRAIGGRAIPLFLTEDPFSESPAAVKVKKHQGAENIFLCLLQ